MIMILGKGQISKEAFVTMLGELGFTEPSSIVQKVERYGKATIKDMCVLYVR